MLPNLNTADMYSDICPAWEKGYMSDNDIVRLNRGLKLSRKARDYLRATGRMGNRHIDANRECIITGLHPNDYMYKTNIVGPVKRKGYKAYRLAEDSPLRDGYMLKYPDLYEGMMSMIVSIDEYGNPMMTPETFKLRNLRKFCYEKRARCAGAQLLVYKYDCYLPLYHSDSPLHVLIGVKNHPYAMVKNVSIEESELCECCPNLEKLRGMSMSALANHMMTQKHVLTKWNVKRDDAMREMERLRVTLSLSDYRVTKNGKQS